MREYGSISFHRRCIQVAEILYVATLHIIEPPYVPSAVTVVSEVLHTVPLDLWPKNIITVISARCARPTTEKKRPLTHGPSFSARTGAVFVSLFSFLFLA